MYSLQKYINKLMLYCFQHKNIFSYLPLLLQIAHILFNLNAHIEQQKECLQLTFIVFIN